MILPQMFNVDAIGLIRLTGTESHDNMIDSNSFDDSLVGVYIYNAAYDNNLFNKVWKYHILVNFVAKANRSHLLIFIHIFLDFHSILL